MQTSEITYKLKFIHKTWEHVRPNSGGCGFIALMLYNAFLSLGKNPEIVVYGYVEYGSLVPDETQTNKILESNYSIQDIEYKYKLIMDHVCVLCDGLCFDITGVFDDSHGYLYKLTKESLLISLEEEGTWNWVFDRSSIPYIEKDIQESFGIYNSLLT